MPKYNIFVLQTMFLYFLHHAIKALARNGDEGYNGEDVNKQGERTDGKALFPIRRDGLEQDGQRGDGSV